MTAATGLPKRVDPNGLLGLLYTTFEGISANSDPEHESLRNEANKPFVIIEKGKKRLEEGGGTGCTPDIPAPVKKRFRSLPGPHGTSIWPERSGASFRVLPLHRH